MEDQFQRTESLIGDIAVKKLLRSKVIVFGIGGVGGYVCEALARAGIGSLEIVDKDLIDRTNINRQILALHSTVGRPKTEVAEERLRDINPGMEIKVRQQFYLPEKGTEKAEPSVSRTAEKIIGDSPKTKDAVELAEFYIMQHLTENLSLEEVATEACVSPTHLTRLFKKRHQMGVVDFVTEKKMGLAEELMKQDNLTVSYIASKLGYSNYSYFTKVFKKYTGKTPTEYKKELAKY